MTENIILSRKMQEKINNSLERVMIETNADHVVFATKSGEILEHRGISLGTQVVSITALLTGVFNTTKELAKIVNEKNFEQFFIKGRKWKLFYKDISSLFILIVLFKDRSLLGTVKISSEKFANNVNKIFEQGKSRSFVKEIQRDDGFLEKDLLEGLFKG